jgi:hypothetical protein
VENRYILPLVTMVEILKPYSLSVLLQAKLSSLPGLSEETCLVRIQMGEGAIFSCTITSEEGVLLQQEAAYAAVERYEDLEWQVEFAPAGQKEVLPVSIGRRPFASPIPRLRVPLTPTMRATLSHPSVQALLLVDGQRSLEDIARLTSKTPEEVRVLFATMKHLLDFER